MTDRIEGKVAGIMSDQRLTINRGEDDGVTVGMQFAVLSAESIPVVDPETREVLGTEPIAKTLVKVISVRPRHSIARTFRTRRVPNIFGFTQGPVDRTERLESDGPTAVDSIENLDRSVTSGDVAIEVVDKEFDGVVLEF